MLPKKFMSTHDCPTDNLIEVTGEFHGERLDRFIAGHFPSFSRSHIQRCISEGLVKLNDMIPKKRDSVKAGDRVLVVSHRLGARAERKLIAQDIPLDVLYEDEYLLAINKPPGMVVHPGNGNWSGTVVNALLARVDGLSTGYEEDRPGIVHRLDKDTSGILLVAKDDCTHAALAELFILRLIDKRYVGICAGRRPKPQDLIDAPIARSRTNPILRTVHHSGKSAQTGLDLLFFQSGISVLRFRLHTGRTHQIRVHCRHAGFPILADNSYGGGREQIQKMEPLQRPSAYKVIKCFARHALHAYSLEFTHPITGKEMLLKAPLPQDFLNAFQVMGLSAEIIEDGGKWQP